jgi:tetratricopeptide (TPR) repeat protein
VLINQSKSQLAIQYAHHVLDTAPQTFVFWVHASTQARFEEAYRGIADRLELPGRNDPKANVLRLVSNWLCNETNGQWMMVVDNVDDVQMFFPSRERQGDEAHVSLQTPLAIYLPQSRNGSILITSRSKDAAVRLAGGYHKITEVLAMDESQGLQLLWNKLQDLPSEESAVDLLRALDCIPLAITQAAAYINQRAHMTTASYLDEFQRNNKKREHLLNWDAGELRRDRSASNSIVTTWQMSFERIRQERPSAADLLSLMSFFNPQGIPESTLRRHSRTAAGIAETWAEGEADSAFDEDLDTLLAYSFVAVTANSNECEMHALVQFCMQAWLSSYNDAEQWEQRFITLMAQELPTGNYENWEKCQQLLPHIEKLYNTQPAADDALKAWTQVLTNAAWYLCMRGGYSIARQLATKALAARESVFGLDKGQTLTSVAVLALVLQYQGKYDEAEKLNRRALEGREKELGVHHPDTLTSVSNLASVVQYQGKYDEAEKLNWRALEGREKELGVHHPDTLTSVDNLAGVLRYQGKYDEAEKLNWRALEGREKELGVHHPDTLTSVSNLASVMQYQGKYDKAEKLNRRALEGREKELGIHHPDTLKSVSNLALVMSRQSKVEEVGLTYMRKLVGKDMAMLQDTDIEGGTPHLILEPQVDDDFTTASTLQGKSSIGVSQSKTLVGEEEMSNQAKDSLIDEIYDDDPLDASSVSSRVTTAREKDGKAHIAYFLATDAELRRLCSGIMDKVDRAEFADIGRRLLKTFYLGLLGDAQTELEIQSVRLLKSRKSRVRISTDIVDIITSADAQDAEKKRKIIEQIRMRKERLENWAKRHAHTPLHNRNSQPLGAEQHEQWAGEDSYEGHENPRIQEDGGNQGDQEEGDEKHGTYSDVESESESEHDEDTLPNLTEMEVFFRNSKSFQALIYGFKERLLPQSLRDIVSSTPVELSNEEDKSVVNYTKALVEDYTMLDWNWWPLGPRMRPLNPNESRLVWHCVSKICMAKFT